MKKCFIIIRIRSGVVRIEYASLRTAIMNRLHKVNIAIPELQMFNEYGSIIPNNISLLYKKIKGYKPMYNILIGKRLLHAHVLQYQNGETKVIFFHK